MKRLLLALLAVLVLLGIVYVYQKREEARVREARAKARFLQFDDRAVEAVVLTVGDTPWRFERAAEGWRLTSPVNDAVSEAAMADLLSAVQATPVERVIESPEALSAYGLDPPNAAIRLEGVDVPATRLGNVTATGTGVFAQLDGRPGVLVLAPPHLEFSPLVNPDPKTLRDPSLLGGVREEIVGLEVSDASSRLVLAREADGWWIVGPRRLPASDSRVGRWLQALETLEVRDYVDGEDSSDPAFGLGETALRVDVLGRDWRRAFRFGREAGEGTRYATRDDRGTILVVDAASWSSASVDLEGLVTRRLSKVNRYQVVRFAYSRGEDRLAAAFDGERWTTEDGRTVEDEEIYAFLVEVLGLPLSGWRPASSRGESAVGSLEFALESGETGRIEFLAGDRARVSWAPDVVFDLSRSAPPVPQP